MIDLKVFEDEIILLMDWFNRDFEAATLKRLHQRLSHHLTTEQFKEAASKVFDTARFFPTVEDFVNAVKGNSEAQSLEEWEKCLKAASRGDTGVADTLTPAGKFALRSIGGISGLGQVDVDQHKWVKKEFVSAWSSWSPAAAPALPPATTERALPEEATVDVSQALRSLSQQMSLNGRTRGDRT